jgi:hypothetical protein
MHLRPAAVDFHISIKISVEAPKLCSFGKLFFLGMKIWNTHDVQKERKFAAEAKLGLENPEHSTKQVQNFAGGEELGLENPNHSKKRVQNFAVEEELGFG